MTAPTPDETAAVPYLVDPGWSRSDPIDRGNGEEYRLLWWSDSQLGIEHRCDRGPRGVIVCAPRLTDVGQPGGHQVTWGLQRNGQMTPTVTPSVLCPDCGLHGFITDGRWRDA